MRELDKSKVYSLEDLTSDELTELIDYLKKNYWNWEEFIKIHDGHTLNFDKVYNTWYQGIKEPTANAKELFYTLENIQVDCSKLTEEQINDMFILVINKGFQIRTDALKTVEYFVFFRQEITGYKFGVLEEVSDKTTITYEKFMELFGYKEKSEEFKNLVEVLNEELTEEAYKGTEYEVKYIAEKPKQYQAHYNNENGSLYKIATDLGLNHWEFDVFKRLVRCRKKNQFKEDLQKIKDTIDIYLNEYSE